MRIIIEDKDFQRLSPQTQAELLESMAGRRLADVSKSSRRPAYHWREPTDLTPDLAVKLMHGLAENHRRRLELFGRHGGRVSMKELLAVTGDSDLRVLSYFQGAVNRKLRRLLNDRNKKIQLFGWDYDATKWDKQHTTIVDGIYYVSDATAKTLKEHFGIGQRKRQG